MMKFMRWLLLGAMALVTPRTIFASCTGWAGRAGMPVNPGAQGAVFMTLGFTAVALGGCTVLGIVLYLRSKAPRLPHHELMEEMENYRADVPSY